MANILNLTINERLNVEPLNLRITTRKKFIHEELPNNSETEDMRKIR